MPANMREDTVIYEIREHLGVIAKKKNGWSRELNLVCWNNQEPPKFDVRDWSRDHKHMSRGITMYADEMRRLIGLYMDWNNQITVEKAQEEKRRNREEYYRQREAIRDRYSSEQKVVPDDPEDDFDEAARGAGASSADGYEAARSAGASSAEGSVSDERITPAEGTSSAEGSSVSSDEDGDTAEEISVSSEEEGSPDGTDVPETEHPEAFATPAAEAAGEGLPI